MIAKETSILDSVSPVTSSLGAIWPTVSTAAVVIVAMVFAVAGWTKLRNPKQTGADFKSLGLPLAQPLARIIPVVELVVAVGLILQPRIALVAVALLLLFTLVLGRALRQGSPIHCSCFGSLNREPITRATLVRNALLIALAASAATTSSLARPDLAALVTVSMLAVITVVIGQLFVVRRQLGRIWSVELAGESS